MAGRKIKCWCQRETVGGSNRTAYWHGYCPCHLLNWDGPGPQVWAAIRDHIDEAHPLVR